MRDRFTVLLYLMLGVVGFLLNGFGSILGPLQRQLGVSRAEVAFYPSLYALALVVVGLVGGRIVERTGHRVALVGSLVVMAAGTGLLASPVRTLTLVGAVLLGIGAATTIQVVPAALSRRHPAGATASISEANAVSSVASLVGPGAVALALGIGAGWQAGYVLPVLPVVVVLLVLLLRVAVPAGSPATAIASAPASGLEPGRLLPRWIAVVLAVSVEFCLVFWAADAMAEWHGAGASTAPALAALFLVGMALTRAVAGRLTRGRHPLLVVPVACAVAVAGFAVFWAAPWLPVAAAGLLVAGLGVALLYPVTVARLVAAWPDRHDRAASRGALASGLAIGGAPLVLAALADAVGLRTAYLLVPCLLVALAVAAVVSLSRR